MFWVEIPDIILNRPGKPKPTDKILFSKSARINASIFQPSSLTKRPLSCEETASLTETFFSIVVSAVCLVTEKSSGLTPAR